MVDRTHRVGVTMATSPPFTVDPFIRVGYWRPNAVPTQAGLGHRPLYSTNDERSLPDPRDHIDLSWDAAERKMVIAYLRKAETCVVWRGIAHCRICDIMNGGTCKSDGVYMWPEGYAHYLEKHDVRPPQAFIDHVLKTLK